jgi:transposase
LTLFGEARHDAFLARAFTCRKPVCAPPPEHLPRERVVLPGPTVCPCCGGRLAKLGERLVRWTRGLRW